MDDNKQLAQRIDGAIQSASQEVTNLRSELSATSRRLAELGATDSSAGSTLESVQHNHNGKRLTTLIQLALKVERCVRSDVPCLSVRIIILKLKWTLFGIWK